MQTLERKGGKSGKSAQKTDKYGRCPLGIDPMPRNKNTGQEADKKTPQHIGRKGAIGHKQIRTIEPSAQIIPGHAPQSAANKNPK